MNKLKEFLAEVFMTSAKQAIERLLREKINKMGEQ